MTRNRRTARQAGTRDCAVCGVEMPPRSSPGRPRLYCSDACYNAKRRADYTPIPRQPRTREEIVRSMYERTVETDSGCWEWQGYRMPFGYGQVGLEDQRVTTTHRVSWEWANGREVPDGLVVRHKCDNPSCINPDHLEVGTPADNVRDAVDRHRTARGDRLPHTRLSERDVAAIRRLYRVGPIPGRSGIFSNADDLAERFGASAKYVRDVARGRERAT